MNGEDAFTQRSHSGSSRQHAGVDGSLNAKDSQPPLCSEPVAVFSKRIFFRQLGSLWQSRGLKSLPELTRAVLIVLLTTYTLSWYEPFREFFSFSPAETLAGLRVWNLVTYGLIEEHVLHLSLSALVLVVIGPLVEDIWQHSENNRGAAERTLEQIMYLLFVTAFSSVLTFMATFSAFLVLKLRPDFLFTGCAGFYAGNVALLVALARYRPDHAFSDMGILARYFPARMLPLAYVNTIVSLVPLVPSLWLPALVASFALIGSWGYFRYAKSLQLPTPEVPGAPAEFSLLQLLPAFVEDAWKRMSFLRGNPVMQNRASSDIQPATSPADADRRRSTAASLLEGYLRVANSKTESDVAENV
jgi:membrane associated rhomboid family serine protease